MAFGEISAVLACIAGWACGRSTCGSERKKSSKMKQGSLRFSMVSLTTSSRRTASLPAVFLPFWQTSTALPTSIIRWFTQTFTLICPLSMQKVLPLLRTVINSRCSSAFTSIQQKQSFLVRACCLKRMTSGQGSLLSLKKSGKMRVSLRPIQCPQSSWTALYSCLNPPYFPPSSLSLWMQARAWSLRSQAASLPPTCSEKAMLRTLQSSTSLGCPAIIAAPASQSAIRGAMWYTPSPPAEQPVRNTLLGSTSRLKTKPRMMMEKKSSRQSFHHMSGWSSHDRGTNQITPCGSCWSQRCRWLRYCWSLTSAGQPPPPCSPNTSEYPPCGLSPRMKYSNRIVLFPIVIERLSSTSDRIPATSDVTLSHYYFICKLYSILFIQFRNGPFNEVASSSKERLACGEQALE